MEQNNSFDEKKYLMLRIKDKYCSNPKLHKWLCIICLVTVIVMTVIFLTSQDFLRESNNIFLFLLLTASSYMSLKFGQKIEPMTEPRELLREYDSHNRRSWVCFAVLFVAYLLSVLFLKEDLIMAAIVAGVTVVLILVLLLLGIGKDNDIERLRELVSQENDENVA